MAHARVLESLAKRRKHPVLICNLQCIPAELGKPSLGLDHHTINNLRSKVTHIIHASLPWWSLNEANSI